MPHILKVNDNKDFIKTDILLELRSLEKLGEFYDIRMFQYN